MCPIVVFNRIIVKHVLMSSLIVKSASVFVIISKLFTYQLVVLAGGRGESTFSSAGYGVHTPDSRGGVSLAGRGWVWGASPGGGGGGGYWGRLIRTGATSAV